MTSNGKEKKISWFYLLIDVYRRGKISPIFVPKVFITTSHERNLNMMINVKFWIENVIKHPLGVVCGLLISGNIYTARGWVTANAQVIDEVRKCSDEKEQKDSIRLADFQLLLKKSEELKNRKKK